MDSSDFLTVFDWETSGNVPSTTRGVQLAAITVDPGEEPKTLMYEICNPEVDIHHEAFAVHGISNEIARQYPLDKERARELCSFIEAHSDRIILAGHNVLSFDIPILFRLGGRPRVPKLRVIDTLVAATRVFPAAASHKLGELTLALGLGDAEGAHDALADVKMVLEVIKLLSSGLQKDWAALAEWCGQARILTVAHFGKHKGKKWGKPKPGEPKSVDNEYVPGNYAAFIARQWEDFTPDMAATLNHHYGLRIPPRKIIGYQGA